MKKTLPKTVLVIGSGPIVIGQAAEFDYSGTQCCRALKEEGIEVVLVNSNPATIQTDFEFADRIYVEPLRFETVRKIIEREKPDAVIPTMAGQTGLNLAVELKQVFVDNNVAVLGTSIETIELAENREKFAELMKQIGEPVPASGRAKSLPEAKAVLKKVGLPAIIRPDYALGGAGSGIVLKKEEFEAAVEKALLASATSSILVEESVAGDYAEIEYEVIRDSRDNCIVVCNMENLDAMGVHTGESIVVAPSQTLSDKEYHLLRRAAIRIVRSLHVEGACNVQFALNQKNGKYFVIEVNPRTSRSSALASKATGYPIARVATKIALGHSLDEIENRITGKTAAFEPSLDYCVVKIPKWPFDKLNSSRTLGTQMKSTGEVMAIGRNFEEAFQKALRSLEQKVRFSLDASDRESVLRLLQPNELRMLAIRELLRSNAMTIAEISDASKINPWFIRKMKNVAEAGEKLKGLKLGEREGTGLLLEAKKAGYSDAEISAATGASTEVIRFLRSRDAVVPSYKMVDTCSGEFAALTPYYYSSFLSSQDESQSIQLSKKKRVLIIGSGPIRIGQGIEFDYCTVHAVIAARAKGFDAVIANNNPETVSTDYDTASKLYFEPLTPEDVFHLLQKEKVDGVMVQFGGQTAINLAPFLHNNGVRLLGTSFESIDASQDRKKFKSLMRSLGIPTVESAVAFSREEAVEIAKNLSFPLLVRPSYVLGGRAMEIVRTESELEEKIGEALFQSGNYAVIMDRFIEDAIEVDVDALSDGRETKIAGIMEQVEEAGVHSGDSSCVIPAIRIGAVALQKIRDYTKRICAALTVVGLANIQMAVKGSEVFVLEVNPRASRTVPFLSKATGYPIARIAADLQLGGKLSDHFSDFATELLPPKNHFAVKVPVFPFVKFQDVDPVLSPEMKSTGEVMGVAPSFAEAYLKALLAAGHRFGGSALLGECGKWKKVLRSAFSDAGVNVFDLAQMSHEEARKMLVEGKISFVVDGLMSSGSAGRGDASFRKLAVQRTIPCITSAFAALKIAESLKELKGRKKSTDEFEPISLNELHAK